MTLQNCPGCLAEGFDTYCKKCLKKLFDGKKISHVLNFSRPEFNSAKLERGSKLSISGVQVKHSLRLDNDDLILTEKNGQYILKPFPAGQFEHLDQLPANEHLTMQLANQVYNISTAFNGMIFFQDDEPAYITRRFDVSDKNKKLLQEDFAQISQRTEETHGKNYKYDFSYEEIAEFMKKYVNAYPVEVEKYFKVILFNYLFSNGDAHLKNFSLQRNELYGDYLLTPFYDLLNTSLHVPGERDTALELFKDGFQTEAFKAGSKYTREDFEEFGRRIGLANIRRKKIINEITSQNYEVINLISQSFLNDELKAKYLQKYLERLNRIIG